MKLAWHEMAMIEEAHRSAPDEHAVHTPVADLYCEDGHAVIRKKQRRKHDRMEGIGNLQFRMMGNNTCEVTRV